MLTYFGERRLEWSRPPSRREMADMLLARQVILGGAESLHTVSQTGDRGRDAFDLMSDILEVLKTSGRVKLKRTPRPSRFKRARVVESAPLLERPPNIPADYEIFGGGYR